MNNKLKMDFIEDVAEDFEILNKETTLSKLDGCKRIFISFFTDVLGNKGKQGIIIAPEVNGKLDIIVLPNKKDSNYNSMFSSALKVKELINKYRINKEENGEAHLLLQLVTTGKGSELTTILNRFERVEKTL